MSDTNITKSAFCRKGNEMNDYLDAAEQIAAQIADETSVPAWTATTDEF